MLLTSYVYGYLTVTSLKISKYSVCLEFYYYPL